MNLRGFRRRLIEIRNILYFHPKKERRCNFENCEVYVRFQALNDPRMTSSIKDEIWDFQGSEPEVQSGGNCMDSSCFFISKRINDHAGITKGFQKKNLTVPPVFEVYGFKTPLVRVS